MQNNQVLIKLTVNQQVYELPVDPEQRLIDLLRDQLGLTGTKEGCGQGECGACTVILDKKAVNACLVLAFQVDGKEIITIEGLGAEGQLHPIQEAFLRQGAVQCGYCTPGMIMSAKAILDRSSKPTEEEIRRGISGNLCRCTGYQKIVDAILEALEVLGGEGDER